LQKLAVHEACFARLTKLGFWHVILSTLFTECDRRQTIRCVIGRTQMHELL